jgi:glutamine amidotransferase-like uncharacterized protein
MIKAVLLLLAGLIITGLLFCCDYGVMAANDLSPLNYDSIRVALYLDSAVWPNCKMYTRRILDEIGLPYQILNTDSIWQGKLVHYSVLLMPGADMSVYHENLGPRGESEIVNYIGRGGGYIGICGGAFYAARTVIWRGWSGEPRIYYEQEGALRLFKGTADGPIEDFAPSYQDFNCGVRIIDKQHPLVGGIPDTMYYLYDHGPQFIPANNRHDVILGRSVRGSRVLLLATEYYNGRIFLTSGHPEATNTTICRHLIDNAIRWCSKQIN